MPEITLQNEQMSPEDMKSQLESGLEDVQAREIELNNQEILNKNNIKQIKTRAIQSLFALLEDYGVDASNLESINAFLSKLRAQDPDLAELFEIAFTDLTSETENEQSQTIPEDNSGLMSKFKNLAPQMMQGTLKNEK